MKKCIAITVILFTSLPWVLLLWYGGGADRSTERSGLILRAEIDSSVTIYYNTGVIEHNYPMFNKEKD